VEGIAQSSIRPTGTAEFDMHLAEVHSQSEFIDTKSKIKIIKIEDNRIFVTKI
jgi:membrane-bound ClpP family serine protease